MIKKKNHTLVVNASVALKGISLPQRLNLKLIELASFNQMNGIQIVNDLLQNKDLWKAVLIDRPSWAGNPEYMNNAKTSEIINLIKLRDLSKGSWNVSTLYILCYPDVDLRKKLYQLAQNWHADNVQWMDKQLASWQLGGGPDSDVLEVWWD